MGQNVSGEKIVGTKCPLTNPPRKYVLRKETFKNTQNRVCSDGQSQDGLSDAWDSQSDEWCDSESLVG